MATGRDRKRPPWPPQRGGVDLRDLRRRQVEVTFFWLVLLCYFLQFRPKKTPDGASIAGGGRKPQAYSFDKGESQV